jgi:putative ABC transport system permease protein
MQVVEIDKGEGFASNSTPNAIILGYNTAKALFDNGDPLGQIVTIGPTEEFKVIGTMKESKSSASFASEFNNIAAIPFDKATDMNKGEVKIMRIMIKAADNADVGQVKQTIKDKIVLNHNGEEDFTVMTQDDVLDLFSQFLNMATALVSAIAAISIIVGGIGIMNIMLVTVTERTREIGIRKAIGATNMAIMFQFLVEAVIITLLGGIFGVLLTYGVAWGVRVKTTLNPAITLDVLWLAVGLSIVIGVIFGLMPALRAARKNPIEALRYE